MHMLHYLHRVNSSVSKINLPLRGIAAQIITEVIIHHKSLTAALTQSVDHLLSEKELGLLKELCFGTLRWYHRLNSLAQQFIKIPLKQKDQDIYSLILLGLYQLLFLRIPPHAAVSETVAAAYALKKPWAAKLINGVLRQYQRDAEAITLFIEQNPVARYSHPAWFIEAIQTAWPDDWNKILDANNERPPQSCRINARHYTREDYLQLLEKHAIEATPIEFTGNGIIVNNPCDVHQLPQFSSGAISIQDGAAQLAAQLLAVKPGDYVLDACAAPGGKTIHLLEMQPQLEKLIAIDIDEQRMHHVQENLSRAQLSAELIVADAAQPHTWWNGKLFDRILCDAPCSATGVIRRHPDIKTLRRETDIAQLIEQQWQLLNALWPLLKTGGILLYSTCSVLPVENSDLLARFLSSHTDAHEEIINEPWGIKQTIGRQILCGMHNMDGFYYAKLIKIQDISSTLP